MEEEKYSKVLVFTQIKALNVLFWYTITEIFTLSFQMYQSYLKQELFFDWILISQLFILYSITIYQFYNHYLEQTGWKGFQYVISIFFCLEFILDSKFEKRTIEKIKSIYYEHRQLTQFSCNLFVILISLISVNYGYDLKRLLWLLIPIIYLAAFNYHQQFELIKDNPFEKDPIYLSLKFKQLDSLMLKHAFREIIRYYFQKSLQVFLFSQKNEIICGYLFVHLLFNYYIDKCKDEIIKYIDVLYINIDINFKSYYYFEYLKRKLSLILIYQICLPILFSLIYEGIPVFKQNEILVQIIFTLMIYDLYYAFKHAYQQDIIPNFKGSQFIKCKTQSQLENLIRKYDSKKITQLKAVNINFESELVYKVLFNNFQNIIINIGYCSMKFRIENKWVIQITETSDLLRKLLFYLPTLSPEIEIIFIQNYSNEYSQGQLSLQDQIKLLLLTTEKRYPLYIYFSIIRNSRDIRLLQKQSENEYLNKIVTEYECSNNTTLFTKIVFQQIYTGILTYNPIFIFQDLYL